MEAGLEERTGEAGKLVIHGAARAVVVADRIPHLARVRLEGTADPMAEVAEVGQGRSTVQEARQQEVTEVRGLSS